MTNIAIDSGLKSQKDTVNTALREFIIRRKQLEIIKLFGKFDPDSDYDYKKSNADGQTRTGTARATTPSR